MKYRSVAIAVLSAACGGVSEERVSTLETQIDQLRSADAGAQIQALAERVGALETNMIESVQKTETAVQAITGEIAKMSAAPAAPSSAAQADGLWPAVDAVLGAGAEGVSGTDGTYSVARGWLAQQVQTLAASGKPPKLAPAKGGVSIKGVRPKSLADQLGLRNADLIVSVNDKAVANPADVSAALRASNGSATVKLLRKKEEVVLTYKIVD